ncbi:Predicted phosphodiesterase [Andreprevotia lacus DSM 23236]|jgi:predicted phosphodiesterase|uniref:Predicted phosphodiesterase n=1 Tax=Andreprevotia lacus DSM 23236 TaxID=1121001 RepID=A0A1W1Y0X0_9NEIS|nr:metallophosphoesterase family protein [Andreprevotia lacus]SMC29774.1 Predicted phosphodiesterase [Andreprevotia lacus DSM 23236]
MPRRYAILSDIHGNLAALDAVLADLRDWPDATLLELGDTLYGPLAPYATWQRLLAEADSRRVLHINGNQDRDVWEGKDDGPTMQFVRAELGLAGIAWLQSRPAALRVDDLLYACHGQPGDDLRYWLEDMDRGLRPLAEIAALAGRIDAEILLCGHSHTPRVVGLPDNRIIVNPGSVGLPAFRDQRPAHAMQTGSPHARYARLEATDRGWLIDLRCVPYDHTIAVEQALERNRLDWAGWLASGFA